VVFICTNSLIQESSEHLLSSALNICRQSNQWYRLVTVALVHDNSNSIPIHLAFNMLALHSLGSPIEKMLGRARFLVIFFGSLVFASLFSALNLGYNGYSIGVSGAVFGLFGAWIAIGRKVGGDIRSTLVHHCHQLRPWFHDWRSRLASTSRRPSCRLCNYKVTAA